MKEKKYYHLFANGDDAKDFITEEIEFKAAFNRIGVCSYLSGATVVCASVEDTHFHTLLYGTFKECFDFKERYRSMSVRSIAQKRGSAAGIHLNCEMYEINDEQYLRNAAIYTIVQATKDGKAVMPYDYKFGTGALYFRTPNTVMPWMVDNSGAICIPRRIFQLTYREKRAICSSCDVLPGEWLTCNGFILPGNYVDIARFESIFRTHNCFRVFLANNKSRDEEIKSKMFSVKGILIEDLEARTICGNICRKLFNRASTRTLTAGQRITLARNLRQEYQLSYRQLSTLVKISEEELRKYI